MMLASQGLHSAGAGNAAAAPDEDDFIEIKSVVLAKLTLAVGKDPSTATDRDWFVAAALGLARYELRAFSEAWEAKASEKACWGEAKGIAEVFALRDALLLHDQFETKRRARFVGSKPEYKRRLDGLRRIFPDSFEQLDCVRQTPDKLDSFREAFRREVTGVEPQVVIDAEF
jgi:hypothetical protein